MLGWVFFFRQNSTFELAIWWNFSISFESYCWLDFKFEKLLCLWSFFVMLWGFKDCHFGQFRSVIKRYILRYYCISGDRIRLRNCSKMVEKCSTVINDLLQGAKIILLYFIWRMGGWLSKTISIFRKKKFHFISINFFVCYNCSINLKRQSEHSGLCLDTSSLVTIVTEYLCSG